MDSAGCAVVVERLAGSVAKAGPKGVVASPAGAKAAGAKAAGAAAPAAAGAAAAVAAVQRGAGIGVGAGATRAVEGLLEATEGKDTRP